MTELILLSGFLGSGKTTFMVESAKRLEARGLRTAVVTNDQTGSLVDTAYARSENLITGEVSGGCFCCRFPDFLETIKEIAQKEKPDFILAEAVGSCTDLAATVIQPLLTFHSELVHISGFLTLADGPRLIDSYGGADLINPLKPRDVLLSHQIGEASVLILSKIDLLDREERKKAIRSLCEINPRAEIISCSSQSGEGMEGLTDRMIDRFPLDISQRQFLDYQVYAQAEAEYGWYNGSWTLEHKNSLSPVNLSFDIMDTFQNPDLGEVAHGKLIILTPKGVLKVSYVSGIINGDGHAPQDETFESVKVFLNIRAACAPETLVTHVEKIHSQLKKEGYEIKDYEYDSLIPSPPEPTYPAINPSSLP
jgi:G3E family GTPase